MDDTSRDRTPASSWLRRYLLLLAACCALLLCLAAPLSALWIYLSGDAGVDRAVSAQQKGFALFGSGLSATPSDDLVYKLALCRAVKPDILLAGSAGMGSLRGGVFLSPMVNLAGTADSLSSLRESLDAALAVHKPDVVLIALDFWWFSTTWEPDPFARPDRPRNVYALSPDALRMPWQALLDGRLSLAQFCFLDFREGRFGLRAQFAGDGFGPDGAWHASSLLSRTGSPDAGFARTLDRLERGLREFAPQASLSATHLDAFADIYFRLRGRGITPMVFLSPLPGPVCDALKKREALYPHLYSLRQALQARGITVCDTSDPRYFNGVDCEFQTGTRAGEVTALRVLRELTSTWGDLLRRIRVEEVNRLVTEWTGNAAIRDENLPDLFEEDFLRLGCVKKGR